MTTIELTNQTIRMILDAEHEFHVAMLALYNSEPSVKDEQWEYSFKGIVRAYANKYEYACLLYNKGFIDPRLFSAQLKLQIFSIVEDKTFDEALDINISEATDVFIEIRKAYENMISGNKAKGGIEKVVEELMNA